MKSDRNRENDKNSSPFDTKKVHKEPFFLLPHKIKMTALPFFRFSKSRPSYKNPRKMYSQRKESFATTKGKTTDMKQQIQTLNQLPIGRKAVIKKMCNEETMRRRLSDVGLIEGTAVTCVSKAPFGDPAAFAIRGAVIALREEDSKNILVEERG